MSQSGAYSGGGGTSNYSYASSGQSSNYNYLSFFAMGSFGRRLEGQRSKDPTAPGNLEEEKRKWKWIAGAAIAFMFLTNVVAAIGLSVFKYQTVIEEAEFEGNVHEFIQHEMKTNMRSKCQPRYRKSHECSQISAQIVLVADWDRDTVIWSKTKTQNSADFNRTTPGAFECSGIEVDLKNGRFRILSAGVYQIHSHASVHRLAPRTKFQHEIMCSRVTWANAFTVAEETQSRNCSMESKDPDEACFSSSLLATEHLSEYDVISVRFKIDDKEALPADKVDMLVHDGRSTYFGIVKLGVIN